MPGRYPNSTSTASRAFGVTAAAAASIQAAGRGAAVATAPSTAHGVARALGMLAPRLIPPIAGAMLAYGIWQLYDKWKKHEPGPMMPPQEGGYNADGFTTICDNGLGKFLFGRNQSTCGNRYSYQAALWDAVMGKPYETGTRWYLNYYYNPEINWAPGYNRARLGLRQYIAKSTGWTPEDNLKVALPARPLNPDVAPPADPIMWGLNPNTMPIGKSRGTPGTVPWWLAPYRVVNPDYPPEVQRDVGPAPTPAEEFLPHEIIELEAPKIYIGTEQGDVEAAKAIDVPFHIKQSPRKKIGEKEKKVKVKGMRYILYFLNGLTEGLDFIQVMYAELPNKYKEKYPGTHYNMRNVTPQRKLELIYEHIEHIDVANVVEGFIANQLEDIVFASLGKLQGMKGHLRNSEQRIGFTAGPAL